MIIMVNLFVNVTLYLIWRSIQSMKQQLIVNSAMKQFQTVLNARLSMVKWCVLTVQTAITWTLLVNVSLHHVELSTLTTFVSPVMKEMESNGFYNLINAWLSACHLITKSVTLHVRTTVLQLNSPTLPLELVKHAEWPIAWLVMKKVNAFNVIQEPHVLLLVDLLMIQEP